MLVALDWKESEAKSSLSYHFELTKEAKSSNKKFGFKNQNFDGTAVYAQHYLTSDKSVFDEGVIVGAGLVAKEIHNLTQTLYTTIFVSTIKSAGDDLLSDNEYWFVATSDSGYIYSGDDKIISSDEDLVSAITQYIAISHGVAIYFISDDGVAAHLINSKFSPDEDEDTSESKVVVKELSNDEFKALTNETSAKLKIIYRESPIKIKKLGAGLAVAASIAAAVGGWRFYEQLPAQAYFSDSVIASKIGDIKKSAAASLKDFEKSKHWNESSYAKDTIQSFNDFYLQNKLTSSDVGKVMFYIERTLPLFAVEWKMTKINMQEGQFYVTYERIPRSKGTFIILDDFVRELNKQVDVYDIAPIQQNIDPDVRTYRVVPRIKVGLTGEAELLDTQRRELKSFLTQKEKQLSVIEDLSSDWININYQFDNLTPWERFGLNQGETLMESSKRIQSKLTAEEEKLNKLLGLDVNNTSERITPSWVGAKTNEFIILMQTDSLFNWDMPKIARTFPSTDDIANKNYQQKKKKKTKKGDKAQIKNLISYGAAINAYSVNISTNSSEEEGSVRSYGILDLQHLMELLNVPSIQVESVDYSKSDEQWSVSIRFYEKTPEFEKYLM